MFLPGSSPRDVAWSVPRGWKHPTAPRPPQATLPHGCSWSDLREHANPTLPASRLFRAPSSNARLGTCSWIGSLVAFAGCSRCIRRGSRRRYVPAVSLRVVREGDADCSAVARWVDKCVIGLRICPWAKPVKESRKFRIVTSMAKTEDGVLKDLLDEARKLPGRGSGRIADGVITTTILVCPHVAGWEDFELFDDFFIESLDSGERLMEEYGLTIVAFHPEYEVHSSIMEEGDRVVVGDETGTVLEASEDAGNPDEQLAKVRLDDGTETVVSFPMHDEAVEFANLASCAPRPCLHLLRSDDLDEVTGDEEAMVERRNTCAHHMRQVGTRGMEELVKSCG